MKTSRSKTPSTHDSPPKKAAARGSRLRNHVMGTNRTSSLSAIFQEPATKDLHGLLVAELRDIYWAEKALEKALPVMAKKASSRRLVDAISAHQHETKNHVTRLEKVFEALKEKVQGEKCEAMAGLLSEADHLMNKIEEGAVRDAAIIVSAQKVEHYEIATYGSLCAFADLLGESKVASLLKETLNEEKHADVKLTEIAMSFVNNDAVSETSDEDDEDLSGPISS
jgi:ferritin-like metal-binding protein YciE